MGGFSETQFQEVLKFPFRIFLSRLIVKFGDFTYKTLTLVKIKSW